MVEKTAEEQLGLRGRMLLGSKSGYRIMFPCNFVVFNANLIVDGKKVWFGDIDVSRDVIKLKSIARKVGKRVYVLSEMDGRFGENEENPKVENFMYSTDGEDDVLGKDAKEYFKVYDKNVIYNKYKYKKE